MDEVVEDTHRNTYDDLMCQRAMCMTDVAMTYEGTTSPEVKQELLSVLKKLNLSLRVPSTAEVIVIPGSKIVAKI